MTQRMREIRIEKLTLNIGAGKEQAKLEKGVKLLTQLAGRPPVKTITQKRILGWGLRPGLPIGAKLTLRKTAAEGLLPRLLAAKEHTLDPSNFDDHGNISFGVPEYIDVPNAKYDPDIGIMGSQASVTLERPGFRINRCKIMKRHIGPAHRITHQDAMEFMKARFHVKIQEPEAP